MALSYESLGALVGLLSERTKAHICLHDLSGLLKGEALTVGFAHKIHSRAFCAAAKSTPEGLSLCLSCKERANRLGASGKIFEGHCFYGLYELARPVVIDGAAACIVYIGNLVVDRAETERRLARACALTRAPADSLLALLDDAQTTPDPGPYRRLAALIDSYIRLLYSQSKGEGAEEKEKHWAVSALAAYVHEHYRNQISLAELAKGHYINEKYVGSLFKKQTGLSFHAYLNEVRLDGARSLLERTELGVLQIALASGFQNVTYFNRLFLKKFGVPPGRYRAEHRKNFPDGTRKSKRDR